MPIDERRRLAELRSLDLLDTPAEARFDRVTRLARRMFDVPIACVILVDADRAWLKSGHGVAVRELERSVAFCSHTILGNDVLVVEDAFLDARFATNPFVVTEPHLRFYAGHPVRGPGGHAVGTLCILDFEPRSFEEGERESLRDLARVVEEQLEVVRLGDSQRDLLRDLDAAQRNARIDPLTFAWNRGAVDELLTRELSRSSREGTPLSVMMVDVDHFERVNDLYGRPAGDEILRECAERIRGAVGAHDAVGRYGGEEFVVLLGNANASDALVVAERVRTEIARHPVGGVAVTVSVGVASSDDIEPSSAALLGAADRALLEAKRDGRDRTFVHGRA